MDSRLEAKCRSCIGSLMYATVATRPDLANSVYYLSRFQDKASEYLCQGLKRILRYVKGTLNLRLKFVRSSHPGYNVLIGYADANFARDLDTKSTSGYVFKFFGNTVIWRSKRQSVAQSTTEAEFYALYDAIIETVCIKKLLLDLDVTCDIVTLYEDNQSTIKSANNPEQKRLRHMEVKYNLVREEVEKGHIEIKYICSQDQVADIFTKPLCKNSFITGLGYLGLVY